MIIKIKIMIIKIIQVKIDYFNYFSSRIESL
jgi:hypothetical protein